MKLVRPGDQDLPLMGTEEGTVTALTCLNSDPVLTSPRHRDWGLRGVQRFLKGGVSLDSGPGQARTKERTYVSRRVSCGTSISSAAEAG